MAYYQQDDQSDNEAPGSLLAVAIGFSPFLAAMAFSGSEEKMRNRVAKLHQSNSKFYNKILDTAERSPRIVKALRQENALGIIGETGVFSEKTFAAATRAGLRKEVGLLAASRIGVMALEAFNIGMWAQLAGQGAFNIAKSIQRFGVMGPKLEMGGKYFDTQAAYTERQRSLRAITSSRMSTRSALGNEAQLMHR